MSNEISEEFKNWACSFSGCDGGNSEADIWLCGIEWGWASASEDEKCKYYKNELPNEIKKGKTENPNKEFNWENSLTYTYGRSFAKLYKALSGDEVENYRSIENNEKLFRLNLYPIAFSSTDSSLWNTYKLNETTGFDSKYLFNIWCFFNRLPFFNNLRKTHNPKLIICTGVNYLHSFLMSFTGDDMAQIKTGTLEAKSEDNKYDRTFYHVKVENTLLVIIPFLSGRYGLNSDYLLQEMGNEIKKLMENKNDN